MSGERALGIVAAESALGRVKTLRNRLVTSNDPNHEWIVNELDAVLLDGPGPCSAVLEDVEVAGPVSCGRRAGHAGYHYGLGVVW